MGGKNDGEIERWRKFFFMLGLGIGSLFACYTGSRFECIIISIVDVLCELGIMVSDCRVVTREVNYADVINLISSYSI